MGDHIYIYVQHIMKTYLILRLCSLGPCFVGSLFIGYTTRLSSTNCCNEPLKTLGFTAVFLTTATSNREKTIP